MKKLSAIASLLAVPSVLYAQSVTGAYTISQQDLRGTARFMSMGGAFGALGGDLSAISQNPGGIGIYRSNEVGVTFGVDAGRSQSESFGFTRNSSLTKFNLNNIGAVFTMRLPGSVMPNLNFGFT